MRAARSIIPLVVLLQMAVLGVAFAWAVFRHQPFWHGLLLRPIALAGLGAGLFLFALGGATVRLLGHWRPSATWFVDELLYPIFSPLSVADLLIVSGASGVCEEILFRGVIQADLGILLSNVLFGILHTGDRRLLAMGLWTALAGLFLGWLYTATGTLWTPILAHFANNLAALLSLKYWYRPPAPPPGETLAC